MSSSACRYIIAVSPIPNNNHNNIVYMHRMAATGQHVPAIFVFAFIRNHEHNVLKSECFSF